MSRESKRQALQMKRRDFWERNRKSNGYLLRKTIGKYLFRIARALLLFGLCFLILQPLLNKISVSFMEEQDLYDATIISIPRNFTLSNYKLANQLMEYGKALFNSAWVALLVSLLQITACTLVGYGFARYNFPFKKFWFACVILVIVVPPQTISSSLYLNFMFFDIFGIFKALTGSPINMHDTIIPYLMLCAGCMGLKSGLYIFMLRQYFRGIPKELEEAAYVDGCGKLSTFIRIMLPDAKPMLTSCFLFAYVWQWTDSFYSKMFLGQITLLPNALTGLTSRLGDYWAVIVGWGQVPSIAYQQALLSTGTLMAIIPLLLIYVVAQRGFVESLSQTGIKM